MRDRDYSTLSANRCLLLLFALFRVPAHGYDDWSCYYPRNYWGLQTNLWKFVYTIFDLSDYFPCGLNLSLDLEFLKILTCFIFLSKT